MLLYQCGNTLVDEICLGITLDADQRMTVTLGPDVHPVVAYGAGFVLVYLRQWNV